MKSLIVISLIVLPLNLLAQNSSLLGKKIQEYFEINWYNEAPEQILEELEKLGLELVDAQREIEVFVISDK